MDNLPDLALLHAQIGHFARQFADLQKSRIMTGNRIAALDRDGLGGPWAGPLEEAAKLQENIEKSIERQLARLVKRHPMAEFIEGAPGIGLGGFGRLLGITGPLDRFATVSKLWKYLGLHVVKGEDGTGHAPKLKRGESMTHTNCKGGHPSYCKPDCKTDHHPNCTPDGFGTAYNPSGRVLCHQLGDSIVKVGRGPYRLKYDERKAYTEAERPDWTQARRHNDAMRVAVKELVKHMWIEWRRVVPDDA